MPGGLNPTWTIAHWRACLNTMSDVGCSLLIVQFLACDGAASYPSSLSWLTPLDCDPVESLMTAADSCGMKVQLGAYYSIRWGEWHTDSAYLEALADTAIEVSSEIYGRYREHPCLAGWYLVHELPNARYLVHCQDLYARFYNRQAMWIHSRTLLPCSIAPWFDSTSSVFMSPKETGKFWRRVLACACVDILMLQDGIGCHRLRFNPERQEYDNVIPYFQQVKTACDSQIRPRAFWADLEVFSADRLYPDILRPGDIDTIVVQLKMEQKLAEKLIAYEFPWFMNPWQTPWPAAVYREYRALIRGRTNQAPGRAYACSRPAAPQYPDYGQLTDGIKTDQSKGLVGWLDSLPSTIDVPLAGMCSVAAIKCWFLNWPEALSRLPDSVQFFSIAADTAAYLGKSVPYDVTTGLKKVLLALPTEIELRGVRVIVFPHTREGGLTLMSEIEVTGVPAESARRTSSDVQAASCRPTSALTQVLRNPCRNSLELRFASDRPGTTRITIYNSAGRRTIQAAVPPGKTEAGLDITRLSDGVHFVVEDGNPARRLKFIKER